MTDAIDVATVDLSMGQVAQDMSDFEQANNAAGLTYGMTNGNSYAVGFLQSLGINRPALPPGVWTPGANYPQGVVQQCPKN